MEKEVVTQQVFSTANYIDVHVVEGPGRTWRLTGIYGYPQWDDKYKTCDKPENITTANRKSKEKDYR
jgi:hypothetical protein